jgi:hypothetical protein
MKNGETTNQARAGWDRTKAALPWLALVLLLLVPLYALAISFAIRSGVFNLSDRSISNEEFKALWAFIAAGVGTAATIIGFLLTKSHNERTLAFQRDLEDRKLVSQKESDARLTLETVVRGLELMVVSDGSYAPKARIAGSLATLVHLGHPAIAMRALAIVWEEDRVDANTACWLISEAFRTGSEISQQEAAELLFQHAEKLTKEARRAYYAWPDVLIDNWLPDLPLGARLRILVAFAKVVLSQEPSWWAAEWWFLAYLDEVLQKDPDSAVRDSAAQLLRAFFDAMGAPPTARINWRSGWKSLSDIKERTNQYAYQGHFLDAFQPIVERIPRWVGSRNPS